jgi:hypothetical protein
LPNPAGLSQAAVALRAGDDLAQVGAIAVGTGHQSGRRPSIASAGSSADLPMSRRRNAARAVT